MPIDSIVWELVIISLELMGVFDSFDSLEMALFTDLKMLLCMADDDT